MLKKFPMAIVFAVASFVAIAAPPYVDIEQRLTPEQRHATGLDTLSPAQLELLNSLLRDDSARTTAEADETRSGKTQVDEASVTERSADEGRSHAWSIGLDSDPIKTRLKGPIREWGPGTVFELENGQTWKVLKGRMKLRETLQNPEVIVVPGFAGRWFMQIDEDAPKPRVYRID
ncbi:MAG: hypothetical protein ABI451_12065 [Dokdonella sp.]